MRLILGLPAFSVPYIEVVEPMHYLVMLSLFQIPQFLSHAVTVGAYLRTLLRLGFHLFSVFFSELV